MTSFGAISTVSGTFTLELLPATDRSDWADLPLAERPAPHVERLMQTAIDALAPVEGLAEPVGCLVRSCTVLEAEPGFDMSHSTPDLPRSIFVSVPGPDERDAVFRLAESIIHEAMHLQLTLVESVVPLVKTNEAVAFSPWKRSDRPVQGLLHGSMCLQSSARRSQHSLRPIRRRASTRPGGVPRSRVRYRSWEMRAAP